MDKEDVERLPAKPVRLDDSKCLRQSNRLTEASYSLTPVEQKILLAIVSQLEKDSESFCLSRVLVRDLGRFCGFAPNTMYEQIEQATSKLMSRVITFHLPNGDTYQTHWVQACYYSKADSTMTYCIDERLKPDLLRLRAAYVQEQEPRLLMQFRSQYAIRFYLLFKQYLRMGERRFTPEDIIDMFQLGDTYRKLFGNLRNRVIEPAVSEINQVSSLRVSVEYQRSGRKVVSIRFRFHEEAGKDDVLADPSFPEGDERIRSILLELAGYGIASDTGRKLSMKHGADRIERNLRYARKHGDGKRSMSGWIISCIENDSAAEAEETERMAEAHAPSAIRQMEQHRKRISEIPEASRKKNIAKSRAIRERLKGMVENGAPD